MNRLLRYVILLLISIQLTGIAQSEQSPPTTNGTDNPFSQSKFVPDISFILDASYLHRDQTDNKINMFESPGFSSSPIAGGMTEEMDALTGFNFNYGELALSSTVDPYFDVTGILHIRTDGIELEEGYFVTRNLPFGFQIKGGKFLSGFGRINDQHAHYWSFASIPLVYKSFFGPEGLNETGAQITWVAPTDLYFMLGGEILQGENGTSFGTTGFSDATNRINVSGSNGPNLVIGYLRTSFDIGDMVCLAGVSGATGKFRSTNGTELLSSGEPVSSGTTQIVGGNLSLKYILGSDEDLSLQSEFLHRGMKGNEYLSLEDTSLLKTGLDKNQSGFYAQLVYKYSKNWQMGIRYDASIRNDLKRNSVEQTIPGSFPQLTGMIGYNPTEFSRLRLEYIHDRSKYLTIENGFAQQTTNTIVLEINLVIGAHGAHSF